MKPLEDYGRSTAERVEFLFDSLSEGEQYNYFRLRSFIKIWKASIGGEADINEHSTFFKKTNMYALRQIDAVFFKKFGLHIERTPHQLDMSDEEWRNGIKPTVRINSKNT